jgi:uncharacterized membrane protein
LSRSTDHQINMKAELEIELLHQKIDQLRETEVMQLTRAVQELALLLNRIVVPAGAPSAAPGLAPAPAPAPAPGK